MGSSINKNTPSFNLIIGESVESQPVQRELEKALRTWVTSPQVQQEFNEALTDQVRSLQAQQKFKVALNTWVTSLQVQREFQKEVLKNWGPNLPVGQQELKEALSAWITKKEVQQGLEEALNTWVPNLPAGQQKLKEALSTWVTKKEVQQEFQKEVLKNWTPNLPIGQQELKEVLKNWVTSLPIGQQELEEVLKNWKASLQAKQELKEALGKWVTSPRVLPKFEEALSTWITKKEVQQELNKAFKKIWGGLARESFWLTIYFILGISLILGGLIFLIMRPFAEMVVTITISSILAFLFFVAGVVLQEKLFDKMRQERDTSDELKKTWRIPVITSCVLAAISILLLGGGFWAMWSRGESSTIVFSFGIACLALILINGLADIVLFKTKR